MVSTREALIAGKVYRTGPLRSRKVEMWLVPLAFVL